MSTYDFCDNCGVTINSPHTLCRLCDMAALNFNEQTIDVTTAKEEKAKRRKDLRCVICPPNKGENSKRKAKHGSGKPRHKDKR